jgi:hypothetical protein
MCNQTCFGARTCAVTPAMRSRPPFTKNRNLRPKMRFFSGKCCQKCSETGCQPGVGHTSWDAGSKSAPGADGEPWTAGAFSGPPQNLSSYSSEYELLELRTSTATRLFKDSEFSTLDGHSWAPNVACLVCLGVSYHHNLASGFCAGKIWRILGSFERKLTDNIHGSWIG